jgi:hypothetical protein
MSDIKFLNIQLDIAGSFFMNLIGQNMTSFVKIIQKMVTPPNPFLVNGLSKLYVENVTLDKRFDNALIPRARPRDNEIVTEVHWIFVVKEQDANEIVDKSLDKEETVFIVYNPYEKRMQVDGSQQFCQSHALYMAYKYYSGKQCLVTNPRDAYIEILDFWKLLIANMPTLLKSKKHIAKILRPIFKMNMESEKDKELVKKVISGFPKDIHGIYDIMTTDKAKKECPVWI